MINNDHLCWNECHNKKVICDYYLKNNGEFYSITIKCKNLYQTEVTIRLDFDVFIELMSLSIDDF